MASQSQKKQSKYWDMVQDLVAEVGDYQIDNLDHARFILDLFDNLDPYNVEEELSEKQILWLVWLWNKYVNDNDQDFEWEDVNA